MTNTNTKKTPESVSNHELVVAVIESVSMLETLRKLGLKRYHHKTIKKRMTKLKLVTHHWKGQASRKGSTVGTYSIPLQEILVQNSTYSNTTLLKKKLIKAGLITNICSECNQKPVWNGKTLNLHLHHKNKVATDNRLENLAILCPNCHSQQHQAA